MRSTGHAYESDYSPNHPSFGHLTETYFAPILTLSKLLPMAAHPGRRSQAISLLNAVVALDKFISRFVRENQIIQCHFFANKEPPR